MVAGEVSSATRIVTVLSSTKLNFSYTNCLTCPSSHPPFRARIGPNPRKLPRSHCPSATNQKLASSLLGQSALRCPSLGLLCDDSCRMELRMYGNGRVGTG